MVTQKMSAKTEVKVVLQNKCDEAEKIARALAVVNAIVVNARNSYSARSLRLSFLLLRALPALSPSLDFCCFSPLVSTVSCCCCSRLAAHALWQFSFRVLGDSEKRLARRTPLAMEVLRLRRGKTRGRSWLPGHPVDSSLYTARISRSFVSSFLAASLR